MWELSNDSNPYYVNHLWRCSRPASDLPAVLEPANAVFSPSNKSNEPR